MPELGFYYYKARIYSPYIGRFLQIDPIGYEDQWNLYAYVGNDPVNKIDPTGKKSECEEPDAKGNQDCSVIEVIAPSDDSGVLVHSAGLGGGDRDDPLSGILDEAWELYCSLPSIGGSTSIRGYDAVGGGLVGEIAFDPESGNLRISGGFDIGIGFGGSGGWSSGNSATMDRGVSSGWSGSIGLNANTRLGPVAAGAGNTLLGPNHADFNGVSAGVRPGGSGATVNANVGARVGYGGQLLPSCEKKQ